MLLSLTSTQTSLLMCAMQHDVVSARVFYHVISLLQVSSSPRGVSVGAAVSTPSAGVGGSKLAALQEVDDLVMLSPPAAAATTPDTAARTPRRRRSTRNRRVRRSAAHAQ